jgi:hypothetical protein
VDGLLAGGAGVVDDDASALHCDWSISVTTTKHNTTAQRRNIDVDLLLIRLLLLLCDMFIDSIGDDDGDLTASTGNNNNIKWWQDRW